MKGNPSLSQALLTGVQRVAKESIFSQFNNARVYTVLHKQYAPYFGLTVSETEKLLADYGRELNQCHLVSVEKQVKIYEVRFDESLKSQFAGGVPLSSHVRHDKKTDCTSA